MVAGIPAVLITFGLLRLLYWPLMALIRGEHQYDMQAAPLTRRGVVTGALKAPLYVAAVAVALGLVVLLWLGVEAL